VREPERLLSKGATDFERKLLSAVQGERPSPELELRMQRALGLTDATLLPTGIASAKASSAFWLKLGLLACVGGGLVIFGLSRPAPDAAESGQPAPPALLRDERAPLVSRDQPVVDPAPNDRATAGETTRAAEPSSVATLREEIALLDQVRAAASSGDPRGARAALGRYRARFPDGVLRAEAKILADRLPRPPRAPQPANPGVTTPSEAASRR
jgi:hypothetical protein